MSHTVITGTAYAPADKPIEGVHTSSSRLHADNIERDIVKTPRYYAQVLLEGLGRTARLDRPVLIPLTKWVTRDPRYMLDRDYYARMPGGRTLRIDRNYTYDGASIWSRLGLTWALSVPPYHPWVQRAALVHDVLCDMRPAWMPSEAAADRFVNDCIEDGIKPRTARRMGWFIKKFGPEW